MEIIDKIRASVDSSDFVKSVSVLFSGNLIANSISFISIPLISRLYSETAFGDYAITVSVASILVCFTAYGLSSAIMIPTTEDGARKVLTTTFGLQFVSISALFIVIGLLFFLFNFKLYSFSGNYFISLCLTYIYTIIYSLFSLLLIFVNKLKKNRVLFWNSLINASSLLLITIPLGLLNAEGFGFMIAACVSYSIACFQMIKKTTPFVRFSEMSSIKDYFRLYKDFVIYQYPSNILSTFTIQLPNQFFSRFLGNSNLGGYAMCERVLGVPMRLIGGPINTVYFRQSSIYVNEGKNLSSFTYKLIKRILFIAFFPILLVLLFATELFTFILGSNWTSVGDVIKIMIYPYLLNFCSSCLSYCLVVLGKQKYNLYLTIVQFVLISGFIIIGYCVGRDFFTTLLFFSVALSVYNIINLITIFHFLGNYQGKFVKIIIIYTFVVYLLQYVVLNH